MMHRKTAVKKTATKKAMPKMAKGGKTPKPMVMKNGKSIPAFAADGKGKMGYGGKLKKMKNGGKMKKC
jgi:hypothetical protein